VSNFDWLPFTPLWSPSPVLHPPSAEDIPRPPAVGGKVAKERRVVICAPSPPSVRASVVVRQPVAAQVLVLPSHVLKTRWSCVVIITHCIMYARWDGKVAKPIKARPPELAVIGLGPAVPLPPPLGRHAHLAVKGRVGSISLRLLVLHRRLPCMKLSKQRLDHRRSCSPCLLHDSASSPTSPGRRFGVPHGLLRSA
jgi:hypothetical protein